MPSALLRVLLSVTEDTAETIGYFIGASVVLLLVAAGALKSFYVAAREDTSTAGGVSLGLSLMALGLMSSAGSIGSKIQSPDFIIIGHSIAMLLAVVTSHAIWSAFLT